MGAEMKLRFYVDLWPGFDPARFALFATTQPGAKTDGWKRVAFDVAIPDSLVFSLDAVAPEVSRPEEVEDHTEQKP
jgi:hypothetical protein